MFNWVANQSSLSLGIYSWRLSQRNIQIQGWTKIQRAGSVLIQTIPRQRHWNQFPFLMTKNPKIFSM